MVPRGAVFGLLLAVAALGAQGQGIPSSAECQNRVNSIGQAGLLSQLSSCQGGATAECCSKAQGLVGFPGTGQLAGCLCNADVLEATLSGIENNQLAKSAGVTRSAVQNVFDSCSVPTAARAGSCPSGGGTAVNVAAPGTNVTVQAPQGAPSSSPSQASGPAPSGGVNVQAPGTNVQVQPGGPSPSRSQPAGPAPSQSGPAPSGGSPPMGVSVQAPYTNVQVQGGSPAPAPVRTMPPPSFPSTPSSPPPSPSTPPPSSGKGKWGHSAPPSSPSSGKDKWGGKFGGWYPGYFLEQKFGKHGRKLSQVNVAASSASTTVTAPGANVAVNSPAPGPAVKTATVPPPSSPSPPPAKGKGDWIAVFHHDKMATVSPPPPPPPSPSPPPAKGKGKGDWITAVHQATMAHVESTVSKLSQAHQAKMSAVASKFSKSGRRLLNDHPFEKAKNEVVAPWLVYATTANQGKYDHIVQTAESVQVAHAYKMAALAKSLPSPPPYKSKYHTSP